MTRTRAASRQVGGAEGHAILLVIAAAALGLQPGSLRADEPAAPVFAPDPARQADLTTLAAATAAEDQAAALDRLREMAGEDRALLVRELAWFQSRADGGRSSFLAGTVIAELDLDQATVVNAVIPLLDSEDARLAAQAGNILGGYEGRSAERLPDFSAYREVIAAARRTGAPVPRGLVAYMYESSPGTALLTMTRAMGLRQPAALKKIIWGERRVGELIWKWRFGFQARDVVDTEARTQLERLSRHEAWWVRLYVPAIVLQHAALRDKAMLERLASDENALVARFAKQAIADTNDQDKDQ